MMQWKMTLWLQCNLSHYVPKITEVLITENFSSLPVCIQVVELTDSYDMPAGQQKGTTSLGHKKVTELL